MYFWRQDELSPGEDPPQFTMDSANELRPYFERFKQSPEKTSSQALELILVSWLNDMAEFGQSRARQDPALTWLSDSGLLDALKGARIELSAVP